MYLVNSSCYILSHLVLIILCLCFTSLFFVPTLLETNCFVFYWKCQFLVISFLILRWMFLEHCSSSESSGDVSLTLFSVELKYAENGLYPVFANTQGVWVTLLPSVCPHCWWRNQFLRSRNRRPGSLRHEEDGRKEEHVFLSKSRCSLWDDAWLDFSCYKPICLFLE